MRIVIVGAGIAGLALAASLARSGRPCVVVEQARDFAPVGSGVRLAPNATRLMTGLGLGERLAAASVRPERRDILAWKDGRRLYSTPLGEELEKQHGAPLFTLLRPDLHRILLDAVPEGVVQPGRYVTDVLENSDEVTLRCSDGRELHGDVAIAADGTHSTLRSTLRPGRPHPLGQAVFRGVLPAGRSAVPGGGPRVRMWVGPEGGYTDYPVGGGRLSFSATVPRTAPGPEPWSTEGRAAELCRLLRGWDPEVLDAVPRAEWIGRWELSDQAPVPAWTGGRTVLIGDAAHPMLPYFGQGADQALEDAAALAPFLVRADALSVDRALAAYSSARKERTARLQALGRRAVSAFVPGAADAREDRRRLLADVERAESDWIFPHDAAADATRRARRLRRLR